MVPHAVISSPPIFPFGRRKKKKKDLVEILEAVNVTVTSKKGLGLGTRESLNRPLHAEAASKFIDL